MQSFEEIMQARRLAYTKAAIIGYWRQGAPFHIIALIIPMEEYQVEEIIKDYQTPKKYSPCQKSPSRKASF